MLVFINDRAVYDCETSVFSRGHPSSCIILKIGKVEVVSLGVIILPAIGITGIKQKSTEYEWFKNLHYLVVNYSVVVSKDKSRKKYHRCNNNK
jgi:hypothetical protein